MATTVKQDNDFLQSVVGTGILESAIEWIESNLSPDDVFTKNDLAGWAESNIDKINEKYLIEWAEENGYVKE